MQSITAKTFNPKVDGISEKQLEVHFALYNGYVTNYNTLIQKRSEESDPQKFSELTRRTGFEYNGIRLHELYFANLAANTNPGENFKSMATSSFGSFDDWKADFQKVTTMRGIGWGIVFLDPETNTLINSFVADHEIGMLANVKPVLVCDLWEHAYSVDFLPNERAKYLEIFWHNIDWKTVEERI